MKREIHATINFISSKGNPCPADGKETDDVQNNVPGGATLEESTAKCSIAGRNKHKQQSTSGSLESGEGVDYNNRMKWGWKPSILAI